MAQVALRLMVYVNTCYFYARASFTVLLPKFMLLDRSLVENDLDRLEGRGVSRVTIAQRHRDYQARHSLALKGLKASLLDRAGFPKGLKVKR